MVMMAFNVRIVCRCNYNYHYKREHLTKIQASVCCIVDKSIERNIQLFVYYSYTIHYTIFNSWRVSNKNIQEENAVKAKKKNPNQNPKQLEICTFAFFTIMNFLIMLFHCNFTFTNQHSPHKQWQTRKSTSPQ